jgi:transcription elongation factor Elf1
MPELGDRPKGFGECPECGKRTLSITSERIMDLHYYAECISCGFKKEIGYMSLDEEDDD